MKTLRSRHDSLPNVNMVEKRGKNKCVPLSLSFDTRSLKMSAAYSFSQLRVEATHPPTNDTGCEFTLYTDCTTPT